MGEHGNHKSVHVATLGILLQYLRAILPQVGKNILRGILFDFLYGCKSVTDGTVDRWSG